ncbi:MAG: 3-hydroxyacyl-ACP dehydratase FabZ [Candidatus Binatia bacterium]
MSGRPRRSDYDEIWSLLPHEFPFQFVDRVLEFEDGRRIVTLKNVSIDEPFFRGHFPGMPVMPGVLICEALAQAGALLAHRSRDGVQPGNVVVLAGLDKARFRQPVVPGDQLRLEVVLLKRHRPLWRMHGVARVDGKMVAEAELTAMEVERTRRP